MYDVSAAVAFKKSSAFFLCAFQICPEKRIMWSHVCAYLSSHPAASTNKQSELHNWDLVGILYTMIADPLQRISHWFVHNEIAINILSSKNFARILQRSNFHFRWIDHIKMNLLEDLYECNNQLKYENIIRHVSPFVFSLRNWLVRWARCERTYRATL